MKVSELIGQVKEGTIVLPDFQRSFIWDAEDIRELLVSILGDYFIGTILILEDLKDHTPFALRLIEGVEEVDKNARIQPIVKILLDGQQRTTALFYAIYEPNIPVRNRKSSCRFFLDVDEALRQNWEASVVAVSSNDKKKLSMVRDEKTFIPFSDFTQIGKLATRFQGDHRFGKIVELVNDFMSREINIVSLPRGTDEEKIVETFGRINKTGVELSVFELLTARLYKDGIKLRNLLNESKTKYSFIDAVEPEHILKVIALMRKTEPKRKNLLSLNATNFEEDWKKACDSLQKAFERMTDTKDGYGAFVFKKWAPYSTLIVPLAAAICSLKFEGKESARNYSKLDKWYWITVFSNRYDQGVDSSSYSDLMALKGWFDNDSNLPDFVQKFDANSIDLDTDKQNSATYRGVICLIVRKGARDFETGQPPQFERESTRRPYLSKVDI